MKMTFLEHISLKQQGQNPADVRTMTVTGDTKEAAIEAFKQWTTENRAVTVVAGGVEEATQEMGGKWSITFRFISKK